MDLTKISLAHKGYLNAVLSHIEKVSSLTREDFDIISNDGEPPLITLKYYANNNYYFAFKILGAKAEVSYVPTADSNVQPGGGHVTGQNIMSGVLDQAKKWAEVIEGNQREDEKLKSKGVRTVYANGELHRVPPKNKPWIKPPAPVKSDEQDLLSRLSREQKARLDNLLAQLDGKHGFKRDDFKVEPNDAAVPLITLRLKSHPEHYFSYKVKDDFQYSVKFLPTNKSNTVAFDESSTRKNAMLRIQGYAQQWLDNIHANREYDAKFKPNLAPVVTPMNTTTEFDERVFQIKYPGRRPGQSLDSYLSGKSDEQLAEEKELWDNLSKAAKTPTPPAPAPPNLTLSARFKRLWRKAWFRVLLAFLSAVLAFIAKVLADYYSHNQGWR